MYFQVEYADWDGTGFQPLFTEYFTVSMVREEDGKAFHRIVGDELRDIVVRRVNFGDHTPFDYNVLEGTVTIEGPARVVFTEEARFYHATLTDSPYTYGAYLHKQEMAKMGQTSAIYE